MPLTWKLREWLLGRAVKLRHRRRPKSPGLMLESLERRVVPVSPGTVTGFTFIDANTNGAFDEGEIPVTGLLVRLTGTSDDGPDADVGVETTTDADGRYRFISVPEGSYTLEVEAGTALTGGDITINNVTVASSEVTRDVPVGTLRAELLSLRQFLTTSPPFKSPENFPFDDAGGGRALATNDAPILRPGAETDIDVATSSAPTIIDLVGNFTDPNIANSRIQIHTTLGDLNLELFDVDAPQTVENFYQYATSADYDSSIFHRLIDGFVLQGGGFVYNEVSETFSEVPADPAVENEFSVDRSNLRGTIAMAKLGGDPDSATNQFFFNLGDNSANLDNQNGGFTVFGRLVDDDDLDVLDNLADTPISNQQATNSAFTDLPLVDYVAPTGEMFPSGATNENFLQITSIDPIFRDDFLSYSLVSNSNPTLVTAVVANHRLSLTYAPGQTGEAAIVVRAMDQSGAAITTTFNVRVTTPPVVNSLALTPATPQTASTMTATASVSDADSDPVTLTYVWQVNGNTVKTTPTTSATTDTLALGTEATVNAGDTVTVRVTPNDGVLNGTTATATRTVVANSAPVVNSLTLDPDEPRDVSTLTATAAVSDTNDDPVTVTYVWKVNDSVVKTTTSTSSTTDTLSLGTETMVSVGDVISVEVTPNDGLIDGTTVMASRTVSANSAPTATVAITPTQATTETTLTATAMPDDVNGDPVSLTFVWKVNGMTAQTTTVPNAGSSVTNTLELGDTVIVLPGDIVSVEVTPNDGQVDGTVATDSVTIDTAPTATVSLSPDNPSTMGTLVATATTADVDDDPVTLTYVWMLNDTTTVRTTNATSSLTDALDLTTIANLQVGDTITVTVTPNDGALDGASVSDSKTIAVNAAPSATVAISPSSPTANATLTATAMPSDPNGDAVTLIYEWTLNGTTTVRTTDPTSSLTDELDLTTIENLQVGDTITVTVTPNDGALDGTLATDMVVIVPEV